MTQLLTQIADYDEPGSWGRASEGWPIIHGDHAYHMFVFANCVDTIPYGSYVLMHKKGRYEKDPKNPQESCLRVHPDLIDQFKSDYDAAGRPSAEESIERREKTGKLDQTGNRESAPKWW